MFLLFIKGHIYYRLDSDSLKPSSPKAAEGRYSSEFRCITYLGYKSVVLIKSHSIDEITNISEDRLIWIVSLVITYIQPNHNLL